MITYGNDTYLFVYLFKPALFDSIKQLHGRKSHMTNHKKQSIHQNIIKQKTLADLAKPKKRFDVIKSAVKNTYTIINVIDT